MVAAVFVFSGGCAAVVDGLGAAPGTISVEQALTLACFSYFFSFFVFLSVCFFTPFSFTPHKPPLKRRFITKYQKKIASHLTQPLRGTEGLSKLPGDTQKSGKVQSWDLSPHLSKCMAFPLYQKLPKAVEF